ncbi:MAG: stage V sporulation protein AC [Clostridia bacterium]
MTNKEYDELVKKHSKNSPLLKDTIFAFLIGGLICAIGQVIFEILVLNGIEETNASSIVPIILIFIGTLLTGLKIYDKIAKHAGAGTIVPITGFANSIVAAAMEFKPEGYILGIGAKMFVIAGPVLVYGISASVVYGLILVLFGGY